MGYRVHFGVPNNHVLLGFDISEANLGVKGVPMYVFALSSVHAYPKP